MALAIDDDGRCLPRLCDLPGLSARHDTVVSGDEVQHSIKYRKRKRTAGQGGRAAHREERVQSRDSRLADAMPAKEPTES